jgi:hypothetical protein
LSNEYKIAFLKAAEADAAGEFRLVIGGKLAGLYYTMGQFDPAADYLRMQYEAAKTKQEKEEILPKLLDACLKASKGETLAGLVEDYLSKADLDVSNNMMQSINDYFAQPPAGTDPAAILKALETVKVPRGRPKWQQRLIAWKAGLTKAGQAEESQ